MTTNATKRTCACGCGVFLRSTSGDDMTWACRERRVKQAETRPDPPLLPRAGSRRRAVLDALPGTVSELQAKVGRGNLKNISYDCRELVMAGLAVREKIDRVGRNGEITRYLRVDWDEA